MFDRRTLILATLLFTLSLAAPAFAQFNLTINVNCTRGESLAKAAALVLPNTILNVKGACTGPVSIATNGLQLNAVGAASINGTGQNAVTITGAQRVAITGFTITGGMNGVLAQNGAQVTLVNDTVTANALSGIVAQTHASITANSGASQSNGFHGIDVESTSALVVTGSYNISGNGVFGINVNNGSSLTLTAATLAVSHNTLGIQMGTNASGFMDGQSSLNSSRNLSDGITLVSGSHMVDFGGSINTGTNGIHGISLNSKAGLDLDAGSQVYTAGNGADGVHMEQGSVMTIFNNPQFSQVSTATKLIATGNGGDGVNLLTGSRMLVDNFAALWSITNIQAGVVLDDGSSLSFGQTIPVSSGVQSIVQDNMGGSNVSLTFGSHLTYIGNDTIDSVTCDASSLVRGPGNFTCPR
jgi:hypothetical protein